VWDFGSKCYGQPSALLLPEGQGLLRDGPHDHERGPSGEG
jgi:hypothetical protein